VRETRFSRDKHLGTEGVDVRMSGVEKSKHSFYGDLRKSRIESVGHKLTNFHCNVSEEPAL
jgi:hypothetical protein